MQHKTPLSYHFKKIHIWFDISVLAMLFVLAYYVPLLKIVPLVASLELFSFFSFHLLAKRSRFQLQGFLGGFISSTAVFLQVLRDPKFNSTSQRDLLLSLFFALSAMLFECLFIIFFLSGSFVFSFYLPFISQLICIIIVIFYLNYSSAKHFENKHNLADSTIEIELLNDHPIIWKNVIKLSLLIFAIISSLHYIGNELGFSREISALLISLFEAHAILASVMTEWSLHEHSIDLMLLFFIILIGNTISKSYLVLTSKNLKHKSFFILVLLVSLAASFAVTYLYLQLN